MVNQLPQGWKEEELGNLVDIFDNLRKPVSSTERLLRIKNKDKSELYPYYGATGLVDYIDGYIFDGEYLLLGEDGCPFLEPLKDKAYIISGKTWVNNHAHVLRAKESKTSNKFLLYYLNKFDYNGIVSGATRLKLNQNSMKKIPVCYPTDKDEQDYIVKTLDAVTEMIKLRKETIQLTKDLIPAIFQEMFGNIRGSEPIKKHVIVNPRKVSLNDDVEVSFFSMADVSVDGYILSSQRRRYSDVRNGFSSFMNDDVILAKITPCYENGKGAIVRDLINGIGFGSTEFYVLRCDKQYILPEYLFYLLRSDDFMELGKCHMKGAAGQKRLDKSFLQNFGIVYPPLPLQKEFADKVEQINQNLEVQQKDLDRLQELFDQLLQKAFTGELTRGEDYGKH